MKRRSVAPPFDVRKVIRAAMEAALDEPAPEAQPKKHRLPGGRAVLLGASLFTAGRLLVGGRAGDLVGSIEDRLAGLGLDVPGKAPADPGLDDEPVEEPEGESDDLDDDEAEVLEGEDDEELDEPEDDEELDEPEEGEASNGGAPERRPRSRRRGR